MNTTATQIRTSEYDDDGRVACAHRDMSVCKACFAATPGLVDVYDVQYRFDPTVDGDLVGMAGVTFSPGTLDGIKES